MAMTALKGNPVQTVGEIPAVGDIAPDVSLTGADQSSVSFDIARGQRVVLNIFPSVETGVCAAAMRRFNELAAGLDNTTVLCVSNDSPETQAGFCAAEGIENVVVASAQGSSFGEDYGVLMTDGPMEGLLARCVIVLDEDRRVTYTQLVPEIATEPDYDAPLEPLR